MTDNSEKAEASDEKLHESIKFDYIKSNFFRVIKADGIHGGVTPRGTIHMAFFNERNAIPLQVIHKVAPDGKLGEETDRTGRDSIVREVEVDVVLTPGTARSVAAWLLDRANQAEEVQAK